MERGLYIAASGMLAEQVRQDQLANDLANASTPGYKPDRTTQRSFEQVLLANDKSGQPIGSLGLGVEADHTYTDLAPAPLRETGEPLDFGIEGSGFFAVQTPNGVRYTRDGQFSAGPAGLLVDDMGRTVLSQAGTPIRVRADGTVDPRQLGVFNVPNAGKQGDGLFAGTAAGRANAVVRSGALEGSGVDPARAMVDMIASFRAYEANQKAISTIDDALSRAAGQVGSLSG